MKITTEEALKTLIAKGIKANIHSLNIEFLQTLIGTNPDPDVIDFYSRMIASHVEAVS